MRKTALLFASLTVATLLACGLATWQLDGGLAQEAPVRPNIIFILADDMDTAMVPYMPKLRSLLISQGTTFQNAFVTNSLCCPSRATILRGQYSHNHQILGNRLPAGGFKKFRNMGHEDSTVATWLRAAGHRTVLLGKYFNEYGDDPAHVPPGWSRWYGVSGHHYYDYELNTNGSVVSYGGAGRDYETDVLKGKATQFVRNASDSAQPFFVYLAPSAPHEPATPAPRHEGMFAGVRAPRPPSFDEKDVSDKPRWVRDRPSLTKKQVTDINGLYRNRLRSMMAVDDAIGGLVRTLRDTGELKNTYIFFTSDNGYKLGQHRLGPGKWTAYEEDIKVPLVVRGPGVPEGEKLPHLVLNNDLAPTFSELGGAKTPPFVDGRSLVPLLDGTPPPRSKWRSTFLVEAKAVGPGDRPAYEAVRTPTRLYVEYSTGERELYDLREDPYQLRSRHETADPQLLSRFRERLEALRDCAAEACRAAED